MAVGEAHNIDIEILRSYYLSDNVLITRHAADRCRQRGIISQDIRAAVMNGEVIEDYPDDFPFPSCLILGCTDDDKAIHVCMSNEGSGAKIITAYVPSAEKWQPDLKTRKEVSGFDGVYVIIENVPCRKCEVCGEEFFTSSVMEKVDEIITSLKNIASKIFIVDYKAAA